jgi:ABC-type multidrug transport system permease subunit
LEVTLTSTTTKSKSSGEQIMALEQSQSGNDYGQLPENPSKIQQLQHELGQEFMKALNNSKVNDILKAYGLTAEEVVKFKAVIDLHKMQQTTDASSNPEVQGALTEIPGFDFTILSCCIINGFCVPW